MASSYRSAAKQRIHRKIDEINELKTSIYSNIELITNEVTRKANECILINDAKIFKANFAQTNADLESCLIKLTNLSTVLLSKNDEVDTSEDDDSGSGNERIAAANHSKSMYVEPATLQSACKAPDARAHDGQEPQSEVLESVPRPSVSNNATKDMLLEIRDIEVHIGQSLVCIVTHVESPALFYLQRVACKEIDDLSDALGSLGHTKMLDDDPLSCLRSGMALCVLDTEMNLLQRAVITELHEARKDEVCVFYVDSGESQTVHVANLRPLKRSICDIPRQAIPCSLKSSTMGHQSWSPIAKPIVGSLVHAVIVSTAGPTRTVDLFQVNRMTEKDDLCFSSLPNCSSSNGYQLQSDICQQESIQCQAAASDRNQDSTNSKQEMSVDAASSKICFKVRPSTPNLGLDVARPACFQQQDDDETDAAAVVQNEKPTTISDGPLSNRVESPDVSSDRLLIFELPTQEILLDGMSKCDDGRRTFTAFVSAVIDSFHFYVHPLSKETAKIDELRDDLQLRYKNSPPPLIVDPNLHFVVGSFWCCQFSQDDKWYRARILDVAGAGADADGAANQKRGLYHLPELKVCVQFVDYGDTAWIGTEHLRFLHKDFCKLPILAQKCRLANTELSNGTYRVVSTEELFGEITDRTSIELEVVDTTPEYLSVVVRDRDGDGDGKHDESSSSTLNVTTVIGDESTLSPDELTSWNPMQEEYDSMRNSYNVDVDDAGVALTGYKAKDESDICMFYRRNQPCPRGNSCKYKHIKPRKDGTTTDKKAVPFEMNYVDLPEIGAMVAVKVTAIIDPSQFWVNFPLMTTDCITTLNDEDFEMPADNLWELQEYMQSEYKGRVNRHGDNLLRMRGEIVAARFGVDGNWYRARVLDVDEENATVTVSHVDYGNNEVVPESDVRDLSAKFLHLPAQAVECCLSGLEPINGDEWSDDAKMLFTRLTDEQNAIARVVLVVDDKMVVDLLGITAAKQSLDISTTLIKAKCARRTASAIK